MTTTKLTDYLIECERLVGIRAREEGLCHKPGSLDAFVRGAWPCNDEPEELVAVFMEVVGKQLIEEALASCDALCTSERPCAAVVNYELGEEKPWRISDDWVSENYASVAEAIEAAKTWYEE